MWRIVVIVGVAVALLSTGVVLGCRRARPAVETVGRVSIDGTRFLPDEITVPAGGTVSWRNRDPFPHNVVSPSGEFRSGDLSPGGEWHVRLVTPGVFAYICTLHPGMKGVVRVR